jgi:hypothetical protein
VQGFPSSIFAPYDFSDPLTQLCPTVF